MPNPRQPHGLQNLKNQVKLAHKEGPKEKEPLSVKVQKKKKLLSVKTWLCGSLIKDLSVNNGWYLLGWNLVFVGLHWTRSIYMSKVLTPSKILLRGLCRTFFKSSQNTQGGAGFPCSVIHIQIVQEKSVPKVVGCAHPNCHSKLQSNIFGAFGLGSSKGYYY